MIDNVKQGETQHNEQFLYPTHVYLKFHMKVTLLSSYKTNR